MRLLIVSHTEHYPALGPATGPACMGWGPTVREISHLARLFDQVTHLAPLHPGPAPASALTYTARNVVFRPLEPTGGPRLRDKIGAVAAAPRFWRTFDAERRDADVVHLRAPANIAALAILRLALDRPKRRAVHPPTWVKYAGNWRPEPGTDFRSFRAQRRLLQRHRPRTAVTVNGVWPDQPPHVHSFHNPSFDRAELATARRAAAEKTFHTDEPLRLLFVGGLSAAKGADRVVDIFERVRDRLESAGRGVRLDLVGDGPLRSQLDRRAQALGGAVTLHGWRPPAAVAEHYAGAHLVLLPSRSEGWPKVLSEAMAHGAVPMGSDVSGIAATLRGAATGVALPRDDTDAWVDAVLAYAAQPERWRSDSESATRAADRFSYEAYLDAVRRLFDQSFGIELPEPA